jgi:hypothetical protein
MTSLKMIPLAVFVILCTAFTLFHHGWSNYDQKKVLDYTGTIEESTFENPHSMAKIKDKDKTWTVVLAPPSRMSSRGAKAEMLKKGTSVRVVGYPHLSIADEMRAERIFIDGKKYELR